jgi:hypothetical protein
MGTRSKQGWVLAQGQDQGLIQEDLDTIISIREVGVLKNIPESGA